VEIIKEPPIIAEELKKLRRPRDYWRKIIVCALIALGTGVLMLACYLMFNGKLDTDGLITILVITVFGLIFGISFLDRIGI
jgi:polyferredoxin